MPTVNSCAAIYVCCSSIFLASRRFNATGIGGGTGGGAQPPQLSAYRGLAALAPPPTGAENKATTIHPQTTCYILHAQTSLYLMAAPSLMFHFLDSFRRSLLLEARFSA